MQVRGVTANAVDNTPGVRDRQFQLNLDGQEITQQVAGGGFGQPRFSREAIAEFQVVTNLFDITQGRSLGMQVQAISRSGHQQPDRQLLRVLPRRQPERQGLHRRPGAAVFEPADRRRDRRPDHPGSPALLPVLRARERAQHDHHQPAGAAEPVVLVRHQDGPEQLPRPRRLAVEPQDHLTVRASYWDWGNPFTQVSGTEHPSQAADRSRTGGQRGRHLVEGADAARSCRKCASATRTSTGRTCSRFPSWPTPRTTCSRR